MWLTVRHPEQRALLDQTGSQEGGLASEASIIRPQTPPNFIPQSCPVHVPHSSQQGPNHSERGPRAPQCLLRGHTPSPTPRGSQRWATAPVPFRRTDAGPGLQLTLPLTFRGRQSTDTRLGLAHSARDRPSELFPWTQRLESVPSTLEAPLTQRRAPFHGNPFLSSVAGSTRAQGRLNMIKILKRLRCSKEKHP